VSGALDAHVLEFPEHGPPRFRIWPVSRAESEDQGGSRSGSEEVQRPGAVPGEQGSRSSSAVPRSGRAGAEGASFISKVREALGPAQQELGL